MYWHFFFALDSGPIEYDVACVEVGQTGYSPGDRVDAGGEEHGRGPAGRSG